MAGAAATSGAAVTAAKTCWACEKVVDKEHSDSCTGCGVSVCHTCLYKEYEARGPGDHCTNQCDECGSWTCKFMSVSVVYRTMVTLCSVGSCHSKYTTYHVERLCETDEVLAAYIESLKDGQVGADV